MSKLTKSEEFLNKLRELDKLGILERFTLKDLLKDSKISYSYFKNYIYPSIKDKIEIKDKYYKKLTKVGHRVLSKRKANFCLFRCLQKFLRLTDKEKRIFLKNIKKILLSPNKTRDKINKLKMLFSVKEEPLAKIYFRNKLLKIAETMSSFNNEKNAEVWLRKEIIKLLKTVKLDKEHTNYYVKKDERIKAGKIIILKK